MVTFNLQKVGGKTQTENFKVFHQSWIPCTLSLSHFFTSMAVKIKSTEQECSPLFIIATKVTKIKCIDKEVKQTTSERNFIKHKHTKHIKDLHISKS